MLFSEEKEEYIKAAEEILSGKKDSYINIQKGEIQREGDKLWSAFNGMFKTPIEGRQTVIMDITHSNIDKETGDAVDTKKEPVAFDAAEENGIIGIWRATPIGGPSTYDDKNNLVTQVDIYAVEGAAGDCYPEFKDATPENGFAFDAITHASDLKYVVTGTSEDYNEKNGGEYKGGSVKDVPMNDGKKPIKIFSIKIEYDGKNTKAEGAERSAMDKYGKTASGQPE